MHGFYIELTRGQAASAPADYIRRQTLKGAERYITPELKDFEDKVLSARERSLSREKQLYDELLDLLARDLGGLQRTAEAVAELDTLIEPRRARAGAESRASRASSTSRRSNIAAAAISASSNRARSRSCRTTSP